MVSATCSISLSIIVRCARLRCHLLHSWACKLRPEARETHLDDSLKWTPLLGVISLKADCSWISVDVMWCSLLCDKSSKSRVQWYGQVIRLEPTTTSTKEIQVRQAPKRRKYHLRCGGNHLLKHSQELQRCYRMRASHEMGSPNESNGSLPWIQNREPTKQKVRSLPLRANRTRRVHRVCIVVLLGDVSRCALGSGSKLRLL